MALRTKLTARSTAYLISSLLVVASVAGGVYYYKKFLKNSDVVLETVGPFQIKESQVQYQMAVNKLTIPQATDRDFAIKQVREIFAYQTILEKYGWEVGAEHIEQEAIRIKTNTRSRRLLELVQQLPGFKPTLYKDIFVRGTLVRRVIFNDFYFSKKELHEETKQQAERLAASLRGLSHTQVSEKLKSNPLVSFDLIITADGGFHLKQHEKTPVDPKLENPTPPKFSAEQRREAGAQWLNTHMQFEKVSDALLFDEGERWALLFPSIWQPQSAHVQGVLVAIQKRPFNQWIEKELAVLTASPLAMPPQPSTK